MPTRYPLALNSVFKTIQGEGALLGIPMTFVRLGGCSVGCAECDTDYKVADRLTAKEIGGRVDYHMTSSKWIWVTGGEPADHDLHPLLEELRLHGKVAMATSGHRSLGTASRLVDFLSVSPHDIAAWKIRVGSELKLVAGLNGLRLADFQDITTADFPHKFVAPCDGKPETVEECMLWVEEHPEWKMTVQAHKQWNLA